MSVGVLRPREHNEAPPVARPPSRILPLVWLALVALLFLAFFGGNLLKLTQRWSKDPSYSHGFLVPLVSLWLAVRAYRRAGRPGAGDVRIGSMAMLAGAMLHLILTVLNNPVLDFMAAGLVLWGVAVAVGGGEWAWGFLFPIGMLFFMFPLPATWTNYAALWLQDWVAQISAVLLDPFVVCYRRGNSLHLAGVGKPLVVAAECSGLRQIISFSALGVLVGGLSRKTPLFRLLLAASAIPVAIMANVARILLMATGAVWFGTHWMHGWMHDAAALVTLPLGLTLFTIVGWGLSCVTAEPRPPESGSSSPLPDGRGSVTRGLLAAIVCLIVALLAEGGLGWYLRAGEIPTYPDIRAAFAALPHRLSTPTRTWHGQDLPGLDHFRARLPYPVDDLLYRQYTPAPAGPPVALFMIYSRQGDDRKHHPEICIRDAYGAMEDLTARRQIALDEDGQRTVMRFRFRTGASQYTTVYYWHYALEAPPSHKLTTLRRLYRRQNQPVPSVTVQVSTVAEWKDLDAVEHGFLAAVDAALCKEHFPVTARIGCHRLPIALVRD
jgi:exosortase